MIRETVTFKFEDEAQQQRFHERLRGEDFAEASRNGLAIHPLTLNNMAALKIALTKLSNEVLGSLPLMEPLARREFGNSNYAILIQRAEEARALLAELDN